MNDVNELDDAVTVETEPVRVDACMLIDVLGLSGDEVDAYTAVADHVWGLPCQ